MSGYGLVFCLYMLLNVLLNEVVSQAVRSTCVVNLDGFFFVFCVRLVWVRTFWVLLQEFIRVN